MRISPVAGYGRLNAAISGTNRKISGKTLFKANKADSSNSKKSKSKLPWKKILAGAAVFLAAASVYYRKNPVRRQIKKEYNKIFTSTDNAKRVFPRIPERDEVILTAAIDGSKRATELFPTLTTKNPGAIVQTARVGEKLERNKKMLKNGAFGTETHKRTKSEVYEDALEHYKRLQNKFNSLYQEYIEPLK